MHFFRFHTLKELTPCLCVFVIGIFSTNLSTFFSEVKIMRWLIGGLLLLGAVVRSEDEVEGEDGVQFEDDTIYRAVIESCSG